MFVHMIESQIRNYIWSGQEEPRRPRLDHKILTRPLEEGGLIVISVYELTLAMAAKQMLWIATDRDDIHYRASYG